MTPIQPRRVGLQFDPTVNAGHVLTTATLLVGLVIWGARLESRVDQEKDTRERFELQYQRDRLTDGRGSDEIKAALRRIEDKIDRKADRPYVPAPG
jgi:hypothetical protein